MYFVLLLLGILLGAGKVKSSYVTAGFSIVNLKELLIKMVRRILFYGFGYSIDYIFKEILMKKHLA